MSLIWNPNNLNELGTPKVIHAGSLGAFLEPGTEITRDILRRGRAGGALIAFDPNIRPSLVRDPHQARSRFTALAFISHITKLSDEDADFLFREQTLHYVLDLLIDGGVEVAPSHEESGVLIS